MVNTANALHDLPVVKGRLGCREYFGVACVSDPGPRPAIDDFTSKQAAIVGLAS